MDQLTLWANKKIESGKLREVINAAVRGSRESSGSRRLRNFWSRSMI